MNQDTEKDLLQFDDNGKAILPTGLNVLTILTFIGCSIFALLTLCMPLLYKFAISAMDKAKTDDMSAEKMADMQKSRALMELTLQNSVPLIAIGMAGIILCFIGALWMRKFKKDGYWMYVAGELAPILGSFFIMGSAQYTGVTSILIGAAVPVLFVVLYTMQRKYLTK